MRVVSGLQCATLAACAFRAGVAGDVRDAGATGDAAEAGDGAVVQGDAAVDAIPPASSGATHAETTAADTVDASVLATATGLAAVPGDLYVAAIATRGGASVVAVAGMGASWAPIVAHCSALGHRIEAWSAADASASEPVTATFSGVAAGAVLTVSHYSGVNPTTPIGAAIVANNNGLAGGCSGGTELDSYSFPITTATADAVVWGAIATGWDRYHSSGGQYAELAETSNGTNLNSAVQHRRVTTPGTTVFDGDLSQTGHWVILAVEIR